MDNSPHIPEVSVSSNKKYRKTRIEVNHDLTRDPNIYFYTKMGTKR